MASVAREPLGYRMQSVQTDELARSALTAAAAAAAAAAYSGAARGKGGSFPPPYGWTSKNYVICVCFHCHGTSSYHTTNTLQGRRAKSHVDTQKIQPGLGDFVL